MKIGILTMHRIVNYGSFLQSYALKETLTQLGYEVSFVDYSVEPCLIKNKTTSNEKKEQLKNKLRILKKKIIVIVKNKKCEEFSDFKKRYINIYLPILGVTNKKNITPKLDCLIIGSDEVFNCLQTNPDVGYSRELFGARANVQKIISYAASFGNTTLEGLKKYGIDEEIKRYLQNFYKISVRDDNSYNIIKALTRLEPEKHLDPVLIYDYSKELSQIDIKHNYDRYIVLYAYTGRITKVEQKMIRKFADEKKAKLIAIGGTFLFCDECIFPSPFETLYLIKNALYVVTDTFHGSVFSIKYNKQFSVFVRYGEELEYGNAQKLVDLLTFFNLENRIINNLDNMSMLMDKAIDYESINKKIERECLRTKKYLESALSIND